MLTPLSFRSLVALFCAAVTLPAFCKNGEPPFRQALDLSGTWSFATDSEDFGVTQRFWEKPLPDSVLLPGTTDTNRKGNANVRRDETSHLSRRYSYEGPAWYAREVNIPSSWAGKHIELFLERTRPSMVWVDGVPMGQRTSLSVPHIYDLTAALTPGVHRLTLRVDNGKSIPATIRSNSHACTASTQTNWNGIIGRLELRAMPAQRIVALRAEPSVKERSVRVRLSFSSGVGLGDRTVSLSAEAFNTPKTHRAPPMRFALREGVTAYVFDYPLGEEALLWDEFSPALYRVTATLEGTDAQTATFGLREFQAKGAHFSLNGKRLFLRGRHDACVFPLTGHTAMGLEQWRHYFRICKSYGLNHVRFHSWCPPEACFEAADLEGVYLQAELPFWSGFSRKDSTLTDYLLSEGDAILKAYGDHPSFVLFALGNEPSGEEAVMREMVEHFRKTDPRPLYAYGSNAYLGSRSPMKGEDFSVTCRVGLGPGYSTHVRASFSFADAEEGGYLNNTYPNTEMDFDAALAKAAVPVISHETGQFQSYPDYREIGNYTGTLAPWNLETFRRRLEEAGMGDQAEAFCQASGAWATELYRADIEMCLRSERMAGFQLLDLQDYPGQGSAYVGILNAFMESKGFIAPERWREFCCETVPLLRIARFCWTGGEALTARINVSNHGNDLGGRTLRWSLQAANGQPLGEGTLPLSSGRGLLEVGTLRLTLPDVPRALRAELTLEILGTAYRNRYPLWIYPNAIPAPPTSVHVAKTLDGTTRQILAQGGRVLLLPERSACEKATVGGLFQTDYWNWRMFRGICTRLGKPISPGTLGLLMNPQHPVFDDFPTEGHTEWQWYAIVKNAYPLILDALPKGYRPIIQTIDNVERNHRLGLLFEFSVGGGRLLVCMADLDAAAHTPEGRQFRASLLRYAASEAFRPTFAVSIDALTKLLSAEADTKTFEDLRNVSYE